MLEKNSLNKSVMTLADNQFLYKLDDSLMWLFNTDSGEYYNLNESSFFVLSLFDGKRTVKEIRQLYVDKYSKSGTDAGVLVEDFNSLLDHFIDAHIITLTKKIDGR